MNRTPHQPRVRTAVTGDAYRLHHEWLVLESVLAAIAQPNEPSNALHREFGFEPVGLLRRVGWKHGRWHDVAWVQLDLGDSASATASPPALS